jgi:hypothetical protein
MRMLRLVPSLLAVVGPAVTEANATGAATAADISTGLERSPAHSSASPIGRRTEGTEVM